jgi:hypothetical protein
MGEVIWLGEQHDWHVRERRMAFGQAWLQFWFDRQLRELFRVVVT